MAAYEVVKARLLYYYRNVHVLVETVPWTLLTFTENPPASVPGDAAPPPEPAALAGRHRKPGRGDITTRRPHAASLART